MDESTGFRDGLCCHTPGQVEDQALCVEFLFAVMKFSCVISHLIFIEWILNYLGCLEELVMSLYLLHCPLLS